MNTIIEKFMAQVNENKDALAVFDNERNLSRKELLLGRMKVLVPTNGPRESSSPDCHHHCVGGFKISKV